MHTVMPSFDPDRELPGVSESRESPQSRGSSGPSRARVRPLKQPDLPPRS